MATTRRTSRVAIRRAAIRRQAITNALINVAGAAVFALLAFIMGAMVAHYAGSVELAGNRDANMLLAIMAMTAVGSVAMAFVLLVAAVRGR